MEHIESYPVGKRNYRPDIDGLRAIAILSVLLFHIRAGAMPGGFLGVDIFFVISGFLITGNIEQARRRKNFSFADFYERRIRRIIPALYLTMAVTMVPAAIMMWPAEFEGFGKSLKYVAISMGNFEFLDSVQDYFNESTDRVPLLHTWSLAVEEQFYFLYPILLLGLGKFIKSTRGLIGILSVFFVASFAACLWRSGEAPMVSFFMLQYRAWELLAGGILAILMPSIPARLKSGAGGATLAWTGLAFVLWSFYFFDGRNMRQGVGGFAACLGAVLIIMTGRDGATPVSRMLGWKGLVAIGLISYSVYLWHWPLVVFMGDAGQMTLLPGVAAFLASIVLGWASWRWVELPFRKQKAGKRRRVFVTWAVLTGVFVLCSNYIRKNDGLPGRFPKEVAYYLEFAKKVGGVRTKEHYDTHAVPVFGDKDAIPTVALWGDSHAEALIPSVEAAALQRKSSFRAYILSGQPPVTEVSLVQNQVAQRAAYNEEVLKTLIADQSIKTVVLAARWSNPILGKNEDAAASSGEFYQRSFSNAAEKQQYYAEKIKQTVAMLEASGKRVFLVDPIPELGRNVPTYLARCAYQKKPVPTVLACPDYPRRNALVLGVFDELQQQHRITRIQPQQKLMQDGNVTILMDNKPVYRDDDHLTVAGAVFLKDLFLPLFAEP